MGADRIFAEPGTITGSIGIFGVIPTFEDALAAFAEGLGVLAVVVGVVSSVGGVVTSYFAETPSGGTIVLLAIGYVFTWWLARVSRLAGSWTSGLRPGALRAVAT